jgi:hypothetical protein
MATIRVSYQSIDRFTQTKTYKTLKGAQRFAQHWVGAHPEIGTGYAVSGDGVGKITVIGATLHELFPREDEGELLRQSKSADEAWAEDPNNVTEH